MIVACLKDMIPPVEQVPFKPETNTHCDIIAYNTALANGVIDPGNWAGNDKTVDEIFQVYSGAVDSSPDAGSSGYVFYDWGDTATRAKDHMEYYEVSADGTSYTVWETTGFTDPVPKTYIFEEDSNGKGGASSTAEFISFKKAK